MSKFQHICGITIDTLKKKTRKGTNLKFYTTMAVLVLLYVCESWTLRKSDWIRIWATEMKCLRTVRDIQEKILYKMRM